MMSILPSKLDRAVTKAYEESAATYELLIEGYKKRMAELDQLLTEYKDAECRAVKSEGEALIDLAKSKKRIAELEAEVRKRDDLIEDQEQAHKYNLKKTAELKAKLDAALGIGEVHPSWGPKDDFTRGWKECREQFREALQEQKDGD